MFAIAGGILIAVAVLAVAGLGVLLLADNPGAGAMVLMVAACMAAFLIF